MREIDSAKGRADIDNLPMTSCFHLREQRLCEQDRREQVHRISNAVCRGDWSSHGPKY